MLGPALTVCWVLPPQPTSSAMRTPPPHTKRRVIMRPKLGPNRSGIKPSRTIDHRAIVMHGHPMARKKISTTVYITPEQNDLLKQLHQKTRVPVAEYIRQGIDLVLEKERERLPGQLSLDVARK